MENYPLPGSAAGFPVGHSFGDGFVCLVFLLPTWSLAQSPKDLVPRQVCVLVACVHTSRDLLYLLYDRDVATVSFYWSIGGHRWEGDDPGSPHTPARGLISQSLRVLCRMETGVPQACSVVAVAPADFLSVGLCMSETLRTGHRQVSLGAPRRPGRCCQDALGVERMERDCFRSDRELAEAEPGGRAGSERVLHVLPSEA